MKLKFRAWVMDQGKPFMAVQGEPDLETLQSFMFHWGNQKNVMQYTGLKDKNGVEIYEGDILRWKCSKSGSNKEKDYIVTIQWANYNYEVIIHDDGKWKTHKSYWNDENREVVGNIYENPELLESGV